MEGSNKVWKSDKPWPFYATYRKGRKPDRHKYDEGDYTIKKHNKVHYTVRGHDEADTVRRHDKVHYTARRHDEADETGRRSGKYL